jgi:hypothetical protein
MIGLLNMTKAVLDSVTRISSRDFEHDGLQNLVIFD